MGFDGDRLSEFAIAQLGREKVSKRRLPKKYPANSNLNGDIPLFLMALLGAK